MSYRGPGRVVVMKSRVCVFECAVCGYGEREKWRTVMEALQKLGSQIVGCLRVACVYVCECCV